MSEGPITHLTIVVTPKSRMKVRINSYAVFRASWASGTCCASLSWSRDSFIVNPVTFGALIDPPDIAVDGPFPRRSRSSVTAPGRPGLSSPLGHLLVRHTSVGERNHLIDHRWLEYAIVEEWRTCV